MTALGALIQASSWGLISASMWAELGAEECEKAWSSLRDFPQYKYLARPVYKFVAARTNNLIATAASFFVTDLIMHQFLPQATVCLAKSAFNSDAQCDIGWYPGMSLGWLSLAVPVIYAKYMRSQAQTSEKPVAHSSLACHSISRLDLACFNSLSNESNFAARAAQSA